MNNCEEENYEHIPIYEMFPRIYWTNRNPMKTSDDKKRKLAEETSELLMANDNMDILDEALDVMHCCIEIIRDYPYELIDQSIALHNAKNRRRGYYEEIAKDKVCTKQETCKNIGDKENPLYEADQFVCSKCGIQLEDWVSIYYDYDFGYPPDKIECEYIFKFCPNCGRKIED